MSERRQAAAAERSAPPTIDEMIAERIEQLVEIAEATRDCATMLTAVVGELRELLAVDSDGRAAALPESHAIVRSSQRDGADPAS
jgi:hypothetical protein